MTTKKAMAATFTQISLEEMKTYLQRAFRALKPSQAIGRGEVYFDLNLSDNVGIRVWTSIGPHGQAAGVGSDAIRVQLISTKQSRPLMTGKAPIVKRTEGWRDNLADRIGDAMEAFEEKEAYWESRAG